MSIKKANLTTKLLVRATCLNNQVKTRGVGQASVRYIPTSLIVTQPKKPDPLACLLTVAVQTRQKTRNTQTELRSAAKACSVTPPLSIAVVMHGGVMLRPSCLRLSNAHTKASKRS